MLPEGTFIIEIEDRDPDEYYMIYPGQTIIFPFKIPMFSSQTIQHLHVLENSQDWSLACWFSEKPLDRMLFERIDNWNEHKLQRIIREFEIWDELVAEPPHTKVALNSHQTYYVNIRNLQNKANTFKLSFSF